MKRFATASFFSLSLLGGFLIVSPYVQAQSSYYTAQCSSCHGTTASTCAGCHQHSGTLSAKINKTSFTPGETVSVTLSTSGARSGWVGVRLYDQTGSQVATSTGTAGGMGGSATLPTTLSAAAPTTAGSYTWTIAYYGNNNGNGHAEKTKTVSFTVAAAAVDTTAPVVSAFTLPAAATSLSVPVSAFTATDAVGVTGYLITTSATKPAASASGWSSSAPTVATASAAGTVTFYAWAKDAAGNVSAARSATVTITVTTVDTTPPTLTVSSLADGSYTNKVTLNVSGVATDASGIASVTVNGQAVTLGADGSFSTALTLSAGANTVTIVATDKAGNKNTVTRTITYDAEAPALDVTAPADNSTSATASITVSGTVSETSTVSVSVNGGSAQAAVVSGTTFTAQVTLADGINTIDINAIDRAGNTTSAKRTVTYTAPVSQLSLAVTNPAQDITTRNSTLTVKGKVSGNSGSVKVTVAVNGKSSSVKVLKDGSFSQKVTFTRPQTYVIKVNASDAAGNKAEVVRNVIYRSYVKTVEVDDDDDAEDDD